MTTITQMVPQPGSLMSLADRAQLSKGGTVVHRPYGQRQDEGHVWVRWSDAQMDHVALGDLILTGVLYLAMPMPPLAF